MELLQIITIASYALKIIGLAPFYRHVDKSLKKNFRSVNYQTNVFRSSGIGLAYNILLLIIFQIMSAFAVPALYSISYLNKSSVTLAFDVIQGCAACLTVDVILMSWAFRQKDGTSIVNRFLEIDRLLSGIKNISYNGNPVVFFLRQVAFDVSLFVGLIVTEALMLPGAFFVWFFTSAPILVIYSFVLEYYLVVKLLVIKLERVNKTFLELDKSPDRFYRTPISNDCPIVSSFSYQNQLATLMLLGEIRSRLTDLSQDVTDFFSFPILLSIGCVFSALVYNAYFLISPVLDPNGRFSATFITNIIIWIVISVYPTALLCINVTNARIEAKTTGQIVHKLMATSVRREIKSVLKQLSLQLLHEQVTFTAYGFFELDCSMLHSMLGAVTTYLIILIQFRMNDETTLNETTTAMGLLCQTNRSVDEQIMEVETT